MKSHVIIRSGRASVLALLAAGCGASNAEGPVSTTTTTSAPVDMPASVAPAQAAMRAAPLVVLGEDAAAQIATFRCAREDSCGQVGADRAFPTFDACVASVRGVHRQQLTGQQCADGVDPYTLSQCIEDARNEPCGEVSAGPASCAPARLCR